MLTLLPLLLAALLVSLLQRLCERRDEEEEDDKKEMQKGEASGGEGLSDREREKMEKRAARRKKAFVALTINCRYVATATFNN